MPGGTIRADGLAPNTHKGETRGDSPFVHTNGLGSESCFVVTVKPPLECRWSPRRSHGDLIAKNVYSPFLWSLRMFGLSKALHS